MKGRILRASIGLWLYGALACSSSIFAQSLDVSRGTGGAVKLELGYGIALNKSSSLNREWHIINDPRLPLKIESGSAAPKYVTGRSRGEYRYEAEYTVLTDDRGVSAYELRFLVLDVFGARQRLLSATNLVDIAANSSYSDDGQWRLFSETDAATAFYSIAYVATVRTSTGQILRADEAAVLAEVQKISREITAADIRPETQERRPE